MIKKDVFLQFLYLLSAKKIKKYLYLEGGAALSFVYGLKRVFSNDLDFTIENEKFRPHLLTAAEEVIKKMYPNNQYVFKSTRNKIVISNRLKIILQLDIYTLTSDFFIWENNNLFYEGKEFTIKTHSLVDIFAEKITNIFQKDRCEFKDIADINNIFKRISPSLDVEYFKIYLHKKLVGKKIYNKTPDSYLSKKLHFKKSFLIYPGSNSLSFTSQFSCCQKIISLYL